MGMLHALYSMLGHGCHIYKHPCCPTAHNASSGGAHICDSASHAHQSCDIVTYMKHAYPKL